MAMLAGAMAQDSAGDEADDSSADAFYEQLFAVRDAVVAGNHAKIVLPAGAVQRLKTSLLTLDGADGDEKEPEHGASQSRQFNGTQTNTAFPSASVQASLPGLNSAVASSSQAAVSTLQKSASSGLDPIFLEKSDSLVKAESRLKRERIEKALATQSDNTAQAVHDGASGRLDVDALLAAAQERFPHVSATDPRPAAEAASPASSFDENDYYSSLVESEWSPDAPSAKGSDRHIGSFTADFEPLQVVASASKSIAGTRGKMVVPSKSIAINSVDTSPASSRAPSRAQDDNGVDEADDEDEDYSPPEPIVQNGLHGVRNASVNALEDGEEEESDYEPGEITQAVKSGIQAHNGVTQKLQYQEAPTYRSHLTHIAAPQPNRVSPLAVQKGPNIELELVNGRPEIVHKQTRRGQPVQSRASSTSPPATRNGPTAVGSRRSTRLNKQKPAEPKGKKRKRAPEQPTNTSRKRQERFRAQSPTSPNTQGPPPREVYIKPEPISPPGLRDVPVPPEYAGRLSTAQRPIEIDLDSPRQYVPREQYAYAPPVPYGSATQPTQPVEYRAASTSGYRPVQRDTQDLRRVASMQNAQRPLSPPRNVYSPVAPYHASSQGAVDFRQPSMAPPAPPSRYVEHRPMDPYQAPDMHPQAIRAQSYRESSPAFMAPPAARPRQIVVDQYGRQFYAAEPVVPLTAPPAQVEPEPYYERTQSRMSAMPPPQAKQQSYYEPDEHHMAPPPPPVRRQYQSEAPVEYMDTNAYRVREHTVQPVQYAPAPTSPIYQSMPQYEPMAPPPPVRQVYREDQYQQMPPPQAPAPPPQPTSPVYAAPPRAYSVRPEAYEPAAPQYMPRQASVAPVQYARQDMPPPSRAASIMPGSEYGAPVYQQQQRAPSYAMQPPPVRYVDEYGRELVQQDVRQGSQFR